MSRQRALGRTAWLALAAAAVTAVHAAAPVATVRPESVGLSTARLARVTDLMQRQIDAGLFSGAVTLIARNGRVALFTAQGVMDLESKAPMRTDAVFRIMSMTKPIVAVSILMLAEEGKLRLTDPVSAFIPELASLNVTVPNTDGYSPPSPALTASAPLPGRVVPAERPITLRDLLTHTSGLMSAGASTTYPLAVGAGETLAQVLPRLKSIPLDFQPGTRWAYSPQYGFDALAHIVEIAAGMPFDRFVEQRIFAPLGMKDTFFYRDGLDARKPTLYQRIDGALKQVPDAPWMNGAYFSGGGGLSSTAEDYLRFALLLENRGELDGVRLLSPRSVEMMTSVFAPDTLPGRNAGEGFGLGVRVVSNPAARNTWLSEGSYGWSGAFNTHFFVDPKEKVIGIFMTAAPYLETRGQLRDDFENAVMQAVIDD
ncbi:MAG TPA: serine hydrolase domain-containing protein [Gammaproteobacteria bacterium]|nr:serine hydrolase domain-containing protein [Gammaproteobacteria bacterium]